MAVRKKVSAVQVTKPGRIVTFTRTGRPGVAKSHRTYSTSGASMKRVKRATRRWKTTHSMVTKARK